jgi:quercetin dioxygenase-like cupin family protein
MRNRRPPRTELSRRAWLETGLAALAFPGLLADDRADKAQLRRLADIEPERYSWGSIRWLMSGMIDPNAEMTMGLVRIEPHQSNQQHIHPDSAEFLHVLSGSCEHLADGRWVTLKPGDTQRIPKRTEHQARTQDDPFQALTVYDTPKRIMVPVPETKPDAPARRSN